MKISEAIRRMRILRQTGQEFGLVFFRATAPYGIRKYERCRLRAQPIDADGNKVTKDVRKFNLTDRFLYFTDLTTGEAKQCRKRLIRKVRIGDVWYDITLE